MGQPIHRRMVPVFYVQLLYDYLEAQGHEPEALLGEPWPVPDPDGMSGVNVLHWEYLLQTAATRLDDPLLALHVGQMVTVRHLGVLGAVLLASGNAAEALQRMHRYMRLVFDVVDLVVRPGDGWIDLAWDDRDFDAGNLVNETGYTVIVQFGRSLIRGNADPMLVTFKHAAPADVAPYEAFFGCQVRFGEPATFVRFSTDMLALPLKSPDPGLISLLEQHADRLLAQLPQQTEIVEQVRKAIAGALNDGEPDIKRISAQLCCSTRTLQRRLGEAGTSFRKELNLVRYELAQSYMRDPRLQLTDVAMLLGYSEHSAFTRAFKEWSGKPPQAVRESLA